MSEIRMCDNCGDIFSLNSEKWVEYVRQMKATVSTNSMPVVVGERRMHLCGTCAGDQEVVPRPRIRAELTKGE